MKIAIVGMGLIGGSFAKAFRQLTNHTVFGIEKDPISSQKSLKMGAVERIISPEELSEADLTLIALYPEATISFALSHRNLFRKGSIVADVCGVKAKVVAALDRPFFDAGIRYVGTHPMAGREFSGIDYSLANLYKGASFILTPTSLTDPDAMQTLSNLALKIGFARTVSASPEDHDCVIAYTSQLAHVVSNAYVKSPSLKLESGFSAGSFKDLTRVAKCNPEMWTSLFLDNRRALLNELDNIIFHLNEYREALDKNNAEQLFKLLQKGNDLKEWSLQNNR